MKEEAGHLTRRDMLIGMGGAALVTAGALSVAKGQQSTASDNSSRNEGPPPTDPGPENEIVKGQNPDSWTPPTTDAGDVNTFKYPFALGHNRISKGGWARQVTVRDLQISKTMAGVNMRLEKGAVRELHWHAAAEWAYMLTGTARITGVDSKGRAFVDDLGRGDLWYFPSGIPHSIQGLEPDGCEFLLVFDDGKFSEFETFLITDWMAHTPKSVLAKNFGWPETTFDNVPKKELYIFPAPMPGSLADDVRAATGKEGGVPDSFSYRMTAQAPDRQVKGGDVRIVDSTKFKVSTTVASALVTLKPGGLRELHWHPNADEWQYYIRGQGRMTVFVGGGKARTMDFHAGDVGYIDQSLPHYIENTGTEDLEFLELFRAPEYQDISLGQWISHLPPELVQAHLNIDPRTIESVPKEKLVVVPT